VMEKALKEDRLAAIRQAIIDTGNSCDDGLLISYVVPWFEGMTLKESSVDMIFSQAALQYVKDLVGTYGKFYKWLKPNGFMSHVIGFGCHNTAKEWDGQWAYSDLQWKIITGKRPISITREPYSSHIRSISEVGFKIVCDVRIKMKPETEDVKIAPRFRSLSFEDRSTAGTFIQALKHRTRMPVGV